MKIFAGVAIVLSAALPLSAQLVMPQGGGTMFWDTSVLKPPTGAKVAIIEFEDLECPLCAADAPIVRGAVKKYQIPLVHRDFLIQGHRWSRLAAIDARYLEDNVSPRMAEQFRQDVFANQRLISSPDDLQNFAQRWFKAHGQAMPFVMDANGHCAAEVQADCNLGRRLGVQHTPTIIVVTDKEWIEVTQPTELYAAIDRAEADVRTAVPAKARKASPKATP